MWRRPLQQCAPKSGVDEPRSASASWTGERRPPRRIGEERMREGDGVARSHPEPAPSREVVDRSSDDREANAIELAEQRGDVARQCAIHERLEEYRFRAVLTLVHRDELAKNGIGALSARPPSLDPADQPHCPSAERHLDKTLLCRRVQIDSARSDVGAARDLTDAQVGVSTARDLAECRRFDRAGCSRGASGALALYVASCIHCKSSVSEYRSALDAMRRGRYRCRTRGRSRIRLSRAGLTDRRHGPGGLRAVGARPGHF
jgi:hypothetical protein